MGTSLSKQKSKKNKRKGMTLEDHKEKLFEDYKKRKVGIGMKTDHKEVNNKIRKDEYKAVIENDLPKLKRLLDINHGKLSQKKYEWCEVVLFWLAVHFKKVDIAKFLSEGNRQNKNLTYYSIYYSRAPAYQDDAISESSVNKNDNKLRGISGSNF